MHPRPYLNPANLRLQEVLDGVGVVGEIHQNRDLLRMLGEKLHDRRVLLHRFLVLLHELHNIVPDRIRNTFVARHLHRATVPKADLRRSCHCSFDYQERGRPTGADYLKR